MRVRAKQSWRRFAGFSTLQQVRALQPGAQKEEKITEIENQRKRSPKEGSGRGILNQNFNIWTWLTRGGQHRPHAAAGTSRPWTIAAERPMALLMKQHACCRCNGDYTSSLQH